MEPGPEGREEGVGVLEDGRSEDKFFGGESDDCHHGEAAVLDLGELHPPAAGAFRGVEVEGVEAEVSRFVVGPLQHEPERVELERRGRADCSAPEDGVDGLEAAVKD